MRVVAVAIVTIVTIVSTMRIALAEFVLLHDPNEHPFGVACRVEQISKRVLALRVAERANAHEDGQVRRTMEDVLVVAAATTCTVAT